jgi:O-acetyl-ADP-ribose deacetylase (regulator of RNase III)
MTMIYRTGDVFASTCPALGHGVNTLGSMGAGIAVEFRRRWPAMYRAYVQECRSGRLQPGGIFVFQAADRLIVNLATQRGVGRGSARIAAGLGGLAWDVCMPRLPHGQP